MSIPRGFRNNNPGNIRISNTKWNGKLGNNTDGSFEQFETMELGVRAMIVLIRNYINKKKLDNIEKIINVYAPGNENNTEKYIEVVELLSGIKKDETITFDREIIEKIILAMIYVENGRALPNGIFNDAWDIL
jgi:hypothetical protein